MYPTDSLVQGILDAPEHIQEQVVLLLFAGRSVPRALVSIQRGDDTQVRAALDRKDPPVLQQVKELLDSSPPPEPAA
jgi:hypothetical protein